MKERGGKKSQLKLAKIISAAAATGMLGMQKKVCPATPWRNCNIIGGSFYYYFVFVWFSLFCFFVLFSIPVRWLFARLLELGVTPHVVAVRIGLLFPDKIENHAIILLPPLVVLKFVWFCVVDVFVVVFCLLLIIGS